MSNTRIHADRIIKFKPFIERGEWIRLAEKFLDIKEQQIERLYQLREEIGPRDPVMAQNLDYSIQNSQEEYDMVRKVFDEFI